MTLVNLTPHAIVLCAADSTPIETIPPSGQLARVASQAVVVGEVEVAGGRIPIRTTVLGELQGLPPSEDGTLFIVSFIAAQAAVKAGRTDVLVTDDAVRDASGKILGCRALSRL